MKIIKLFIMFSVLSLPLICCASASDTGSITVTVLDNMIQRPATVSMYKDGVLLSPGIYLSEGKLEFSDLEYGTYRFEVIDDNYITASHKAFPHQQGYNSEIGDVELTIENRIISYTIYGDFPDTEGSGVYPTDTKVNNDNNLLESIVDSKFKLGIIVGFLFCFLIVVSYSFAKKKT